LADERRPAAPTPAKQLVAKAVLGLELQISPKLGIKTAEAAISTISLQFRVEPTQVELVRR